MKIDKVTPYIGAEVSKIDLATCDNATLKQLEAAVTEHQVVFLRDQELTHKRQLEITSAFGELEPNHPVFTPVEGYFGLNKLEKPEGSTIKRDYYHTDHSWKSKVSNEGQSHSATENHGDGHPTRFSILYADQVGPYGGDTVWYSTTQAFAALPEHMKEILRTLWCTHAAGVFDRARYQKVHADGRTSEQILRSIPPVIHPMVGVHPVTGAEFLYINELFTRDIIGLTGADGGALLNNLFVHATHANYQVRLQWKKRGAVAIWDNFGTFHSAVEDGDIHHRRFFQSTATTHPIMPTMTNANVPDVGQLRYPLGFFPQA